MAKRCETCGEEVLKPGAKRFCSRACYGEFLKTQPAWNAGRKETRPEVLERIREGAQRRHADGFVPWMKGKTHSAETRAKISEKQTGRTAWNKGMTLDKWSDERKAAWIEARAKPRQFNGSKKLGVSAGDHMRLFLLQAGLCAICSASLENKHEIDHCHTSKRIRGLLCGNCNRGIGLLQEDVEILRSAIAYLETPPAESM